MLQYQEVFDCISGFSGLNDARTLYCTLLNYGYPDLPIPVEDWSNGKIIVRMSNFAELDTFVKREVGSVVKEGSIDSTKTIREQEPNPLSDRAELDNIVFDELGLTEEGRKEVYWSVCELVKQRLEKARILKKKKVKRGRDVMAKYGEKSVY